MGLNPREVRLNQTLENSETLKTQKKPHKLPVWTEGSNGGHLQSAIMLLAILAMVVINKNHKNGYHGSTIQDRDLQKKPAPLILGQSST